MLDFPTDGHFEALQILCHGHLPEGLWVWVVEGLKISWSAALQEWSYLEFNSYFLAKGSWPMYPVLHCQVSEMKLEGVSRLLPWVLLGV